jgi:hypothetical protein
MTKKVLPLGGFPLLHGLQGWGSIGHTLKRKYRNGLSNGLLLCLN